jgi:hypothetical protein
MGIPHIQRNCGNRTKGDRPMANEKRLIDANAVYEMGHRTPFHIGIADLCDLKELLEDVPTVDAVEVVHGRWEKAEYCGFVKCDQCKDVYIDESWLDDGRWNYCPHCGAKMRGSEE